MRTHLLCAAALACALPATSASAFDPPATSFTAASGAGVRVHRGSSEWRDGDRRRERRGGRHDRDPFGYGYGYYEPGQWARYNNRSWEADSFNDWWHERPDRALPRWTQGNRRECKQQYWTSSGWTC